MAHVTDTVRLDEFDVAEYMDTPESQAFFLTDALATGSRDYVLSTLNALARARGMTEMAKKVGMGRQSLYAALGPTGNPTLENLLAIISALGLALTARVEQGANNETEALSRG